MPFEKKDKIALIRSFLIDYKIFTSIYVCVRMCTKKEKRKKKQITPINSNTNYHKEIKLIPIDMDYSLL